MKKDKIIFWICTGIIALMQGLMPILTMNSEAAVELFKHLNYPHYFGTLLAIFKFIGAVVLVVPQFPKWVKEWAYAGFAIDFVSAFVSIWATDGLSGYTFAPLIFLVILFISHHYFHKFSKQP